MSLNNVCTFCLKLKLQHVFARGMFRPRFSDSATIAAANVYVRRTRGCLRPNVNSRPRLSLIIDNRPRLASTIGNNKMYYSTSLYTTATESEKVPFVMKPEFDFNQLFHENVMGLKESILKRNLHLDLNKLIYLWEKVQDVEENMNCLASKREKLKEEANNLNKQKNTSSEVTMSIRTEGKRIRENLKKATALYNSLSEELYLSALNLPNVLHPTTPSAENLVVEVHGVIPKIIQNHVQFGSDNSLLSYKHDVVHPGTCYVQGEAAWLEMSLQWWMSNELLDRGFTRFSSPDMYKTVALEALGVDVGDPEQVLSVLTSESNMYLPGVSSAAFAAYYMMTVIDDSELPQRTFSVGTHYDATKVSKSFNGLPSLMQRNQIEIGCLCHASSESDAVFQQIVTMLLDLYSKLPVQLRLVEVCVQDLLPSMYRKQAIQLLLPSTQEYHEVASVYSCTDYVSRRLKIRYPADRRKTAAQSRKRVHAHTIHGTAVDVPVLLAVLLETCQTKDNRLAIPAELKQFLPKAVPEVNGNGRGK